jgi:hypothetical protein
MTQYTTGNRPASLAIRDFNNDTRLDLAAPNYLSNNVSVLLGNGDGTFQAQRTFSTGGVAGLYSVAAGDVNQDTQPDIVVAESNNNVMAILLGNDDGTFQAQRTFSTGNGSHPVWAVIGDFNNDTRPDIAVANYGSNTVGVFLGNGDGTFAAQKTFSTGVGSYPISVAVGDFNQDTRLDIAVANYGSNTVGIFLGNGDGSFRAQLVFSTSALSSPHAVAIGDFNNDTLLDITVANNNGNNVGVLLGNGDGTFKTQTTYSTGTVSTPTSVAVGDFNQDARLDIAVAILGSSTVGVLLGYGNGTFAAPKTFSTGTNAGTYVIALGDFNNDTRLDITVANTGGSNVGVFLGNGDGTFAAQTAYATGTGSNPNAVAVYDFNKDARLDITVANYLGNNVGVFLGNGDGTFATLLTFSVGTISGPYSIAVADFNNDTRLDITVANHNGNNVGVLLGNGDGTFQAQMTFSTGVGSLPLSVTVGDFNKDTRMDIAVANAGGDNVGVLLGNGDGTFSVQTTFSTGANSAPNAVAVGDFNNDTRLDIVVANYDGNNVGVLLGNGDGTFQAQMIFSFGAGSAPISVAVGDFNNDTRLDIVVANFGSNTVGVSFGNGNGTFLVQPAFSTGVGSAPYTVAVGDFNNDTRPDIAVANVAINNVVIFLGNGNGTFAGPMILSTGNGSYPISVAVGDFNQDTLLDIAVANYGNSSIGIFLNTC